MAENNLTPEQLQALQAISAEGEQLAAVNAVTPEERGALELLRAEQQAAEAQKKETERLASRSNFQRGMEEQGLTTLVPAPIQAIDRTLRKIPGVTSLNRMAAQTLDSALLDYLPDSAKNYLARLGVGYPANVDAEGMPGKIGKVLGETAPFVAFPLMAGEKLAAETALKLTPRVNINPARAYLESMYQTYLKSPKMFLATEAGGAAGAVVAGEMLGVSEEDQENYSPERVVTQRLFAELLGGVIGSGIPNALPSTYKRAKQTLQANLLPFTDAGAEIRAARQMQARAGSQAQRELFAFMLTGMPEGVTPAQWLGDDVLLAQQARILADDKSNIQNTRELTEQIGAQLMQARKIAVEELYDAQGNPRTQLDWARSIIQRVTPQRIDGSSVEIKKDQVDNMLKQSYEAFEPLYREADGFTIEPEQAEGLRELIIGAADAPQITASDESVNTARRWLKNLLTTVEPEAAKDLAALDTPPPMILDVDGQPLRPPTEAPAPIPKAPLDIQTTGDALKLRSKIRAEMRKLRKEQGNLEVRDLYGVAEAELTYFIQNNVSEEVAERLAVTDGIYSQFKVIEDAVYNAADQSLTGQNVSQSIRQSTLATPSQYAQGTVESVQKLRGLALQALDVEYLRDPERAARIVRDLSPEEKAQVQSEFLRGVINRAKEAPTSSIVETPIPSGGVQREIFPSAKVIQRDLIENQEVMRSLGMSTDEIKRITNIADTIGKLEKVSPSAVADLFEDGPASLLELAAVLVGTGQAALIGDATNVGGSLVLAQFMANRARELLSSFTGDQAAKLMADAVNDPELYKALLLKDVAPKRELIKGATYLQNYLYSAPFNAMEQLQEGEERPLAPSDPLFIDTDQASVTPPPREARRMLSAIPAAPQTRGVPGLTEPVGTGALPSPVSAPPPQAVAQGPTQSREMMDRLFPMDIA